MDSTGDAVVELGVQLGKLVAENISVETVFSHTQRPFLSPATWLSETLIDIRSQ